MLGALVAVLLFIANGVAAQVDKQAKDFVPPVLDNINNIGQDIDWNVASSTFTVTQTTGFKFGNSFKAQHAQGLAGEVVLTFASAGQFLFVEKRASVQFRIDGFLFKDSQNSTKSIISLESSAGQYTFENCVFENNQVPILEIKDTGAVSDELRILFKKTTFKGVKTVIELDTSQLIGGGKVILEFQDCSFTGAAVNGIVGVVGDGTTGHPVVILDNCKINDVDFATGSPFQVSSGEFMVKNSVFTGLTVGKIFSLSNNQVTFLSSQFLQTRGALMHTINSTVSFTNVTVAGSMSSDHVLFLDGPARFEDCKFRENKMTHSPVRSSDSVTLLDSSFVGNSGERAGALYVDALNASHVTFAENMGAAGLAPGDIYAVGALMIEHSTFTDSAIQGAFVRRSCMVQSVGALSMRNVTMAGCKFVGDGSGADHVSAIASQRDASLTNVNLREAGVAGLRVAGTGTTQLSGAVSMRGIILDADRDITVQQGASVVLGPCIPSTGVEATLEYDVPQTGALTVEMGAQLELFASADCAAFKYVDETGVASDFTVEGAFVLRNNGNTNATRIAHAFGGTGTLTLRVGGPKASGQLDSIDFLGAVPFNGKLEVVPTFSMTGYPAKKDEQFQLISFAMPPVNLNAFTPTMLNSEEATASVNAQGLTITVAKDAAPTTTTAATTTSTASGGTTAPTTTASGATTAPGASTTVMSGDTQQTSDAAAVGTTATDAGEFPVIPVVAGAAGFVVCLAIIVTIICVTKKRSDPEVYDSPVQMSPPSTTSGTVEYGKLPSDSERIKAATGKEVIAVEWEDDSDEEY